MIIHFFKNHFATPLNIFIANITDLILQNLQLSVQNFDWGGTSSPPLSFTPHVEPALPV